MNTNQYLGDANQTSNPYVINPYFQLIVNNAYLGALIDNSYSWINDLVKTFERGARDPLGSGVTYTQYSERSTTFQLYNSLIDANKTGTDDIIDDDIKIKQIYFDYDAPLYKSFRLDRQSLVSLPTAFAIIQRTTRALQMTFQRFYVDTVCHELVYAGQRGGQLFYLNTADADLGPRGSVTPTVTTSITDVYARSTDFKNQYTNLIDKNTRNNYVADGTSVLREENFSNNFFNVYIDDEELLSMNSSLATEFGNKDWGVSNNAGADNQAGKHVFYTTKGQSVKVVPNLKLFLPRAITEITKVGSSRTAITGLDAEFAPVLIIVPKNEIGVDIFFLDKPQISLVKFGLQEKRIWGSPKFFAKSLGSLYKNTTTTASYMKPTIIANSNLISIWSRSNKPTGQNSTYNNFKIILNGGAIESGKYLNQRELKKQKSNIEKIKTDIEKIQEQINNKYTTGDVASKFEKYQKTNK